MFALRAMLSAAAAHGMPGAATEAELLLTCIAAAVHRLGDDRRLRPRASSWPACQIVLQFLAHGLMLFTAGHHGHHHGGRS